MSVLTQVLKVGALLALLILTLISYPPKLTNVPEQNVHWITGMPNWHPVLKDYSFQKDISFLLFSLIAMGVSAYYAIRWTSSTYTLLHPDKSTYFFKSGRKTAPATLSNQLLALYIFTTFLAGIAYAIFDVGKVWSMTGSIHNAFEIAIMLVLHNGGKVQCHTTFFGGIAFYILLCNCLSVGLSWPMDALWFKIQGVSQDYAMIIVFSRIYRATKENSNSEAANSLTVPHDVEDVDKLFPATVKHPRQLLLLILASVIHLVGNLSNTIWVDSSFAFLFFTLSYATTFPLYAFYLYLDTHCTGHEISRKRICIPDTSRFKTICIIIWSLWLAFFTLRIALIIQSINRNDE